MPVTVLFLTSCQMLNELSPGIKLHIDCVNKYAVFAYQLHHISVFIEHLQGKLWKMYFTVHWLYA